jgi:hypothetical protein
MIKVEQTAKGNIIILTIKGTITRKKHCHEIIFEFINLFRQGYENFIIDFKAVTKSIQLGITILSSSPGVMMLEGKGKLKISGLRENIVKEWKKNLKPGVKLRDLYKIYSTTEEAIKDFN